MLKLRKVYFQSARNTIIKSVLCTLIKCFWNVLEQSNLERKCKKDEFSKVSPVTTKGTLGKLTPMNL